MLVSTFIYNISTDFKCDHLLFEIIIISYYFSFLLSKPSHIALLAVLKIYGLFFHYFCMHVCMHICALVYICICMYRSIVCLVCDVTYRHVFWDNHWVLVSQLVCSSLENAISPTPSMPHCL